MFDDTLVLRRPKTTEGGGKALSRDLRWCGSVPLRDRWSLESISSEAKERLTVILTMRACYGGSSHIMLSSVFVRGFVGLIGQLYYDGTASKPHSTTYLHLCPTQKGGRQLLCDMPFQRSCYHSFRMARIGIVISCWRIR